MTVTDFAGVLGLIAAALVALWMLTGTHGPRSGARHSAPQPAEPRVTASSQAASAQPRPAANPPRHRAPSGNRFARILR